MTDSAHCRTAVVVKDYIGDAVMAIPALRALEMRGPLLDVLCWGKAVHVFRQLGLRLVELSPERSRRTAEYRRVLESGGYDQVILFNRSFRSAYAAWRASVPCRIGLKAEARSPLLTHSLASDPNRYEADSYFDLAMAAGAGGERSDICLPGASRPCRPDGPIVVHAGASTRAKQIPAETLARAVQGIGRGAEVVIVGTKAEAVQSARVRGLLNNHVTDLTGKTDLPTLQALLIGAGLVMGSDTGVTHLAASLGVPTVMVFGPNSASRWGHRLDHVRNVVSPDGTMKSIDALEIIQSADDLLRTSGRGRRSFASL